MLGFAFEPGVKLAVVGNGEGVARPDAFGVGSLSHRFPQASIESGVAVEPFRLAGIPQANDAGGEKSGTADFSGGNEQGDFLRSGGIPDAPDDVPFLGPCFAGPASPTKTRTLRPVRWASKRAVLTASGVPLSKCVIVMIKALVELGMTVSRVPRFTRPCARTRFLPARRPLPFLRPKAAT